MGTPRIIPRPDVTTAQIVLLALTERGPLAFRDIVASPVAGLIASQRTENSFYTALSRLQRRQRVFRRPDRRYELTQAGEYAALKAFVRRELVSLEKPTPYTPHPAPSLKWDGKWRVILFDVPETKRPLRDYLRAVLRRIGFREFQRSFWILPHKPPKFINQLLADPQIRKYARMITTADIDYDDDLQRQFKLR